MNGLIALRGGIATAHDLHTHLAEKDEAMRNPTTARQTPRREPYKVVALWLVGWGVVLSVLSII